MGSSDCIRMCPAGESAGYAGDLSNSVTGSCVPGMWADYACPTEYHYICEIRGCPEGWLAHGGSCYAGFYTPPGAVNHGRGTWWEEDDQKSHEEASAACAALGSTLVHIDDAAENAWLASMLPPLGTDDYWIGATNRDTDGRRPSSDLSWEGDGLARGVEDYSNWFPGEPNNAGAGVNYDSGESACVRMCPFGGSSGYSGGCTRGGWADFPCSTQYRYICEKWWNGAGSSEAFALANGH